MVRTWRPPCLYLGAVFIPLFGLAVYAAVALLRWRSAPDHERVQFRKSNSALMAIYGAGIVFYGLTWLSASLALPYNVGPSAFVVLAVYGGYTGVRWLFIGDNYQLPLFKQDADAIR